MIVTIRCKDSVICNVNKINRLIANTSCKVVEFRPYMGIMLNMVNNRMPIYELLGGPSHVRDLLRWGLLRGSGFDLWGSSAAILGSSESIGRSLGDRRILRGFC